MPEQRIDPVLVEKAIEAFEKAPEYPGEGPDMTDRAAMEAAIRAVDEARGLKEELTSGKGAEVPYEPYQLVRYRSPWRLVEQGDADAD